jgi:hypothetical protein
MRQGMDPGEMCAAAWDHPVDADRSGFRQPQALQNHGPAAFTITDMMPEIKEIVRRPEG